MDGTTFELYLFQLFTSLGYHTRHVGRTADFGADLVIERNGQSAVIQAKRYAHNVGVDAVREASAARNYYRTSGAIVMTNSFFTKNAVILAQANQVQLWDRNVLIGLASQQSSLPAIEGFRLLGYELLAGLRIIAWVVGVMLIVAAVTAGSGSKRTKRR